MDSVVVLGLNPTLQKTLILTEPAVMGGVNRLSGALLSIGGKGANTARIISQLGGNPLHITLSGGYSGELFENILEQEPFSSKVIPVESGVRFCYTHILDNPFEATEYVEPGGTVKPQEVFQTTDAVINALESKQSESGKETDGGRGTQWLVIAGSAAPGFPSTYYLELAQEATQRGCRVVADMQGPLLKQALPYIDLVKINMYEFALTFMDNTPKNQQLQGDIWYNRVARQAEELSMQFGTDFVLTNGALDTLVVNSQGSSRITPEPELAPKNPIGCGDAVTAGVVYTLASGGSLEEGVVLGLECAKTNLRQRKTGTIR